MVVQLLLEREADIAAKDHDEETVFHWVAKNGHETVMQLLQEKGGPTSQLRSTVSPLTA